MLKERLIMIMKKLFILSIFAFSFLAITCAYSGEATIEFEWTAVGDDSTQGTATIYDFEYSTDSVALSSWNTTLITRIPLPAPQIAGTIETHTFLLDGITDTIYYFAIKAIDDAGNISPISNIVSYTMPDIVGPSKINLIIKL